MRGQVADGGHPGGVGAGRGDGDSGERPSVEVRSQTSGAVPLLGRTRAASHASGAIRSVTPVVSTVHSHADFRMPGRIVGLSPGAARTTL